MVGDATDTDVYVAQWRQTAAPVDESAEGFDLEAAAIAAAERLETTFDAEVMAAHVERGGWAPDRPLTDDGDPVDDPT